MAKKALALPDMIEHKLTNIIQHVDANHVLFHSKTSPPSQYMEVQDV